MKKIFIILFFFISLNNFGQDEKVIKDIFEAGFTESKAYSWLDFLSNEIGGRLSGSYEAQLAVEWSKKELDKYCSREGIMHQGFVAEVEHLETINLKEFVDQNVNKNNINLVALDGITDPRNIGSIIRLSLIHI